MFCFFFTWKHHKRKHFVKILYFTSLNLSSNWVTFITVRTHYIKVPQNVLCLCSRRGKEPGILLLRITSEPKGLHDPHFIWFLEKSEQSLKNNFSPTSQAGEIYCCYGLFLHTTPSYNSSSNYSHLNCLKHLYRLKNVQVWYPNHVVFHIKYRFLWKNNVFHYAFFFLWYQSGGK